jgi:hypothetical protein
MPNSLEFATLEKLVRPLSRSFSHELARALVEVEPDTEIQAHYDTLADKNTSGALSPEERLELEAFVRANTFLQILKLEAQLSLTGSPRK